MKPDLKDKKRRNLRALELWRNPKYRKQVVRSAVSDYNRAKGKVDTRKEIDDA